MSAIHVIHKKVGGAAHIVSLLEQCGDDVINANIKLYKRTSLLNESESIYFHQPFSHFCALLLGVRTPSLRNKSYCVLHEAAYYNLGAAPLWRAILGTASRFIVILLCRLIGIKIIGVSSYVCTSYLLPSRLISYAYLFREKIACQLQNNIAKIDLAVIWLRRGGAEISLNYIFCIHRNFGLKQVSILGDNSECDKLIDLIAHSNLAEHVDINTARYKLQEEDFYRLLNSARWFISIFGREGFGLSVFQAVCFGCIVLAPKKGALAEWLPSENFLLSNSIRNSKITHEEIKLVSDINKNFGNNILNEN